MIYGIPVENKLQKQFDILNEKVRWFDRTKIENHVNVLNEIAETGSPYDASYVFHFIFSENKIISNTAAYATIKLLKSGQEKNIRSNLYDSFRHAHNFQNKDLKFLEHFSIDKAVHLFGIASLNHSGYIREEALYCLDNIPSSEKLPYVLLRLNDWVPAVREKAQEILENILPELSVLNLIKHYQLIEQLERTTRVDLEDIISVIHKHICSSKNRGQLLSEMKKATFKARLFCWKILKDEAQKDSTLMEKAIQDTAPEIRQWTAYNLPHDEQMQVRITRLLSDKAVRVRYAALKTIPRDKWHDYKAVLENAIYDDSCSIREYSKFALKNVSNIENFSELYKKRLKQTIKPNSGVIMGLAETGKKEDSNILQQFLKDDRSKVRAAVFRALHKLNVKNMEDLYIDGLNDTGKVRKACANILSDRLLTKIDSIYQIFKNDNADSKKAALKVLVAQGKLEALRYILEAILDENEDIQKLAHKYLERWYRHYYVRAWLLNPNEKVYEETITFWKKAKFILNDSNSGLDHLLSSLAVKVRT